MPLLSLDVSGILRPVEGAVRCDCMAPRAAGVRLRRRFTMANVDVTRNGGSHDGLYAARMYRHNRRRLLRRLRQSRGRSPAHCSGGNGFARVTRLYRAAQPNGGPSGDGTSCGTKKRGSQYRLYAARVYRQDRRSLLRCLRESRRRSPVRSSSDFGGVIRSCRRAWLNGSRGVDIRPCR
jgi:hypothetical protein